MVISTFPSSSLFTYEEQSFYFHYKRGCLDAIEYETGCDNSIYCNQSPFINPPPVYHVLSERRNISQLGYDAGFNKVITMLREKLANDGMDFLTWHGIFSHSFFHNWAHVKFFSHINYNLSFVDHEHGELERGKYLTLIGKCISLNEWEEINGTELIRPIRASVMSTYPQRIPEFSSSSSSEEESKEEN